MKKIIDKINLRKAIQSSFLVIMIFITLFMISGILNSAHEFCPYSIICFGTMYPKGIITYTATIVISGILLLLTIFLGRKFCSYVCFLGTLQEKIYQLNKNKFKQRISWKFHKILSFLKYLVLIGTLVKTDYRIRTEFMG